MNFHNRQAMKTILAALSNCAPVDVDPNKQSPAERTLERVLDMMVASGLMQRTRLGANITKAGSDFLGGSLEAVETLEDARELLKRATLETASAAILRGANALRMLSRLGLEEKIARPAEVFIKTCGKCGTAEPPFGHWYIVRARPEDETGYLVCRDCAPNGTEREL